MLTNHETWDIPLDMTRLPFSRYGSYLSVTLSMDHKTFQIHNCRRLFGEERFMVLQCPGESGEPLAMDVVATPGLISAICASGTLEIVLQGDETVQIRTKELRVNAIPTGGWVFPAGDGAYRVHAITDHNYTTDLVVMSGSTDVQAELSLVGGYHKQTSASFALTPDDAGDLHFAVRCSTHEKIMIPAPYHFDEEVRLINEEWYEFVQAFPWVPDAYRPAACWMMYNLWSCFVRANGNFHYDAVLMSKNGMCAVWSWDHCFNALALLLAGHRQRALEQFFLIFEMQSAEGKLPDLINTEVEWRACVKPPIHGWCFGKMMDAMEMERSVLEKAYKHLQKWTDWHFQYRDSDGDGIPSYIMGNDSGWDNATLFDSGTNLETPDLSAYLYLQMQTLQRIAVKLDDTDGAAAWKERSEKLLQDFFQHSLVKGHFVSKQSGIHTFDAEPTSLLALMPIVLGKAMPAELMAILVRRLERHHVTDHGLATEAIDSPKYTPEGYWRGPVWGPTTLLAVDGLVRAGYPELASRIARNFCDTVAQRGAFENFDALTGKGLCDMGYTWTSSAALCLMAGYLENGDSTKVGA